MEYPVCIKCKDEGRREDGGVLLPLSDYGQEGSSVQYKAWACSHPRCGWNIRIDKGDVSYGDRLVNAQPKRKNAA